MQYLAGTDSVHTTAAICDYLEERATASDEVVVVATVPDEDPTTRRDCQEALNVATVRLATVGEVETELREGHPAPTLLEAADDVGADELVVGTAGEPSPDAPESTIGAVLEGATRPVVVVPVPDA